MDQKAASERPATLGPEGIAALGGFLRATNWKLLYGLNLGTGTPERAAEEAALVMKHAGDHLLAFQLGNEADLYGPAFRKPEMELRRYWSDYQRYVKAVRARTPRAPFAGPDVAVKTDWVTQFAERAKGDAVLVSSHYYAIGPAGAPGIDAQKLLSDDPRLAREMPVLVAAGKTAGVPYRMTEGNTCYHGGQPGVSDAFASALWAADYSLRVAQAGFAGVNLHGGGEGYYAPITGEPNATKLRPEYYGMQLAQKFAGARFVSASVADGHDVNAYAARRKRRSAGGRRQQIERSRAGESASRSGKSKRMLEADRTVSRCEGRCAVRASSDARASCPGLRSGRMEVPAEVNRVHAPAIVMPSMRSVGDATELRKTISSPAAVMFWNISRRFPATVTPSTG